MLMIRPASIDEAVLSDSNIDEVPPSLWVAETEYDEGDRAVAPPILSSELVSNGDFSGGVTGWTAGAGVVIGSGVATATAATDVVTQNSLLVIGQHYRLTWSYSIAAPMRLGVTNAYVIGSQATLFIDLPTGSGTATLDFEARQANFTLAAVSFVFTGVVDNISLKLLDSEPTARHTYRSLTAVNTGNDPTTSPSDWQLLGEIYGEWKDTAFYAPGEKVPGGIIGEQIVANSDFDSDLADWTILGAGVNWIDGGYAEVLSGTYFTSDYFSTIPGRRYKVSVDVASRSGSDGYYLRVEDNPASGADYVANSVALGLQEFEFIASASSHAIAIYVPGAGSMARVKFARVYEVDSDRLLYESLSGNSDDVSITIASPGIITMPAHGLVADDPIVFRTTGRLPTGIVPRILYYVKSPTTDTIRIAATVGGADINTSGSQSGAHSAISNPNVGNDPSEDDGSNWLNLGPTNRWAMFDEVVGTVTSDPSVIDFTLEPASWVDSLALINLENVVSVQIIITVSPEGEVYNEIYDMTSTEGIVNWYTYFTESIDRKRSLLVLDLPSFGSPEVRVIITGAMTADVSVGNFVTGQLFSLGRTLHDGAQIGIIDYSRKDTDEFGNSTILQRAFSKRGSFQNLIVNGQVDAVMQVLSDYRAVPAVYSASEDYDATLIFGFPRDFNIEIAYPLESLVSIELEGLS